jgi:hypothetical protein
MRQGELGHQKCRPNIVSDGAVEVLDAVILDRGVGYENAGVADEDVE